jgi:hypothetical protein
MSAEAVFTADGERFVPSGHARGPWDPDAMHGGAPAALAARALERLDTPAPMRCVRLALEFAGAVPLRPLTVTAALTRPGRRLALAEVVVRADDVDVLRGRATLLRVGDVALPQHDGAEPDVPGPETGELQHWTGGDEREGFHLTAIDLRFARGDWGRGPALGWFRLNRPMVAGEEPTPLQRAVAFADFGNGLSRMLDFRTHLFVNTDLTVHLHREPATEWIALDARTDLDATGAGQATSILRDERGRFGIGAQSLFVDER